MFEWFYGNPRKKGLKDYKWLKQQLQEKPKNSGELKKLFANIRAALRRLEKESLRIFLKDEDIIQKCRNLHVDMLQNRRVEDIQSALRGYEGKLRAHIKSMLDSIPIAKAEGKGMPPAQVFEIYKKLTAKDIGKEIPRIMKGLVKAYDFLEHIHLTHDEIEFYTRKSRGERILDFKDSTEMYVNGGERYILLRRNSNVAKYSLRSQTSLVEHREHLWEFGGGIKKHGTQFYNVRNHPDGFESIVQIQKYEITVCSHPSDYYQSGDGKFRFFRKFNFLVGEDLFGKVDKKGTKYNGINVFMQLSGPPRRARSRVGVALIHGNPRNHIEH